MFSQSKKILKKNFFTINKLLTKNFSTKEVMKEMNFSKIELKYLNNSIKEILVKPGKDKLVNIKNNIRLVPGS